MDHITDKERLLLIEQAVAGDKKALETLVLGVQDLVFNQPVAADARDVSGCGGRVAGYFGEGHHSFVLIQGRELVFYLGVPHCG